MSTLDSLVSVFSSAKDATPVRNEPLSQVLASIQDGTHKKAVLRARSAMNDSEEAYRHAKTFLTSYTMCGTFSHRGNQHLVKHSGIVQADIDHLTTDDIDALKDALSSDPTIVYAFVSPSGAGLKYGVLIDPVISDAAYKVAWNKISAKHRDLYGIEWDKATKDISRLLFTSYDPALHFNPGPMPFHVMAEASVARKISSYKPRNDVDDEQAKIEEALRFISPSCDYATWLAVAMALHSTGSPWAYNTFDTWSSGGDTYKEREIESKWKSFGRTGVGIGTLFHLAKDHGYRPPRREKDIPDMSRSHYGSSSNRERTSASLPGVERKRG